MPPEPESTQASTAEPSSSAEPSVPPANPEPLPDWDIALEEWKGLWELHFVGFGLLFLAMSLFSCFCVVRIKRRSKGMTLGKLLPRSFVWCWCCSVSQERCSLRSILTNRTRFLHLPVLAVRILFAIGYPCLTSALSLIHFAFLEVNKLRLISRRPPKHHVSSVGDSDPFCGGFHRVCVDNF